MSSPPAVEDQARLLEDALVVVRQQTHLMRKCLETPGKLMDALKCSIIVQLSLQFAQTAASDLVLTDYPTYSSTLVSELRTSSLGPKQYYELYMAVFDALRHLSAYLKDSHPVNHLADLYELVQYAGNIIPRLYLMITVGTVYMSIPDAPVKEIMKDMMEMSRGVQHPIRGLFLRYYLSGQARENLPMGGGDGPEGNLQDSISFTLTNFVEMNKLWVRLQHQGHSRERELRTQERKELQLLVGNNLVRLSQLVDLETYKNVILQPLLEQVVQCRDVLAQEYLLEVITQVFPDEFHLHTLDQFLAAVSRLNPHVNVKVIVIALMDRLSSYAARESEAHPAEDREKLEEDAVEKLLEKVRVDNEKKPETPAATEPNGEHPVSETNGDGKDASTKPAPAGTEIPKTEETPADAKSEPADGTDGGDSKKNKGIPDGIKLYEIFFEQVMNLVNAQHLPIQDTTALLVSLANLALNIYPDRLDYIDQVLEYANQKVKQHVNSADLHSQEAQTHLLNLLLAPMKSYVSLFTALALPTYVPLLHSQTYPTRRAVAGEVARSLQRNNTKISTLSALEGVLEILKVLIKEGTQQPAGYPGVAQRKAIETDETIEEQGWLARIVHLIHSDNNDTQFKLLQMTRKAYAEGNERVKFTTPALITSAMKLARKFKSREHYDDNWESQLSALYKFMHASLSTLNTRVPGAAELCIRQFVACGQIADQTGPEAVSYEFFVQAFTIYEEQISDSRAQFQVVCIIAGALHDSRNFSRENYDALITKCAQHGSKLLKKPDQCRAVYLASHLWWAVPITAKGEAEDEKDLYRDGKRVLECLQRALRVADTCMDTAVSVELFVEILNRYVYYFDQQNDAITTKYLNGLIELIHSNVATNQESATMDHPKRHFQRTIDLIASREYEGVITAAPK
ncbi:Vacuolar protein sorting-associated protein [Lachnellula willkommii]|uniref:Vacuolar protein sorting-associated protein 35 n=1 Tax=Lachnellula willkommii TaxID=215461 RepID=A0A559M5U6_9HELO|nr:Vacuolar protein sorting-associated protein [Lachnellula willkommii]